MFTNTCSCTQGQTSLRAYLPNTTTWWFDQNGETLGNQGYVLVEDSRTVPPVFFRADSIIPVAIANSVLSTQQLRKLPLRLDIYPSENGIFADGDLYWDDGDSLDSIESKKYNYYKFEMRKHNSISIIAVNLGYKNENIILDQIRIHGPYKRVSGPGIRYVLKWTEGASKKETNATEADNYITFTGLKLNLTSMTANGKIELTHSMVPM